MPTAAARKIEEKRKSRRKNIRQARRADKRRRTALFKLNTHPLALPADRQEWREEAQSARLVARRNRHEAQQDLEDIRNLRSEYHEHNRLVRLARNRRKVLFKSGLTWVDGHQVATWIAKKLFEARDAGVYFRVTSGIRTLPTATYLWNNAGRLGLVHYVSVAYPCSSNHCGYIFPKGAVDLFPWQEFLAWLRRQHARGRHHDLQSYHDVVNPYKDNVHFSNTGH